MTKCAHGDGGVKALGCYVFEENMQAPVKLVCYYVLPSGGVFSDLPNVFLFS